MRGLVGNGFFGGALLGMFVLVIGAAGLVDAQGPRNLPADRSGNDRTASSADLLALSHDGPDGRQQITIVDPRQRVMAAFKALPGAPGPTRAR